MKIFISSSGNMGDQMVARIVADRIDVLRHEVILDLDGIRGGQNWKNETRNAIEAADWFLPMISPNYQDSSATNWHLAQAMQLKKPILPILISETSHFLLEANSYIDMRSDVATKVTELINRLESQVEVDAIENIANFAKQISHESIQEKASQVSQDARVFIAYSRKQREVAKSLYEMLIGKGKAVFWDAKIHAGATWRQTIQKALDDATHIVVIWTPDAARSDEVEREVNYALSEGKVIIPILSPDIPKLPYHLHGFHYVVLQDDISAIEDDVLLAVDSIPSDDIWE